MSSPYYILISDSEEEFEFLAPVNSSPVLPVPENNFENNPESPQQLPAEEEDPSELENSDMSLDSAPLSPPYFYTRKLAGPRTVTTARKSVLLPTRNTTSIPTPAAPKTSTATATPAPVTDSPATHQQYGAQQRVPCTLGNQESKKRFPTPFEIGESSTAQPGGPAAVPFLQDPTIASFTRLERAHHSLRRHVEDYEERTDEEIQKQVSSIKEDAYLTEQALGAVHTQLTDAQHDIAQLRYRLEQSERHAAELSRRLSVLEQANRLTAGTSSGRWPGHYRM